MISILLIGFGGHARSVADTIEREGKYHIIGYTDNNKTIDDGGYSYLGTDDELENIYQNGTHCAAITIGQIGTDSIRHSLYERAKKIGFEFPVIIDPSAIVAPNSIIEEGTFVGKNVVVNSNSHIGKMVIINTGALVEHDNNIGEFCHLAVRSVLGGTVTIGDNCFIGANATIINNLIIGNENVIGAGSLVLHSTKNGERNYGIV